MQYVCGENTTDQKSALKNPVGVVMVDNCGQVFAGDDDRMGRRGPEETKASSERKAPRQKLSAFDQDLAPVVALTNVAYLGCGPGRLQLKTTNNEFAGVKQNKE